MKKIGKRDIIVSIVYSSDYTNGIGEISSINISTNSKDIMIEHPTVVGILEMAKEKFNKDMGAL